MTNPTDNVVQRNSYAFAVRIVRMYQHLAKEKREFVLSKQVLRSGTSVGANVEEALGGISKKDFAAKMNIAYKEARETSYWLRLLHDTRYLDEVSFQSMHDDCEELLRLLYTIVQSARSE
ncbi:MAG: four helix bundle protein [Bacteroidetes bacterium]|jgi:four helix bundle protein|nr:four helix bundle protein [Bacteroidota bacterium]